MLVIDNRGPAVEVMLEEPGVYVFPSVSNIGRSNLYRALRCLSTCERVNAMTFTDVRTLAPSKFFNRATYDLLMLDRYDLYFGEFMSEICEFAKSGIILVDCKSYRFPIPVKSCSLTMERRKFIVT